MKAPGNAPILDPEPIHEISCTVSGPDSRWVSLDFKYGRTKNIKQICILKSIHKDCAKYTW